MANREHSNEIIQTRYGQGHSFENNFKQICQKMFNVITKNYVSQINDKVQKMKRPFGSSDISIQTRKIAKLSSNDL